MPINFYKKFNQKLSLELRLSPPALPSPPDSKAMECKTFYKKVLSKSKGSRGRLRLDLFNPVHYAYSLAMQRLGLRNSASGGKV